MVFLDVVSDERLHRGDLEDVLVERDSPSLLLVNLVYINVVTLNPKP